MAAGGAIVARFMTNCYGAPVGFGSTSARTILFRLVKCASDMSV